MKQPMQSNARARGGVRHPLHVAAALLAAAVLSHCAPAPASGPLQIRGAYPSIADFQDLASLMALDRLTEQGYLAEPVFYAQSELAVEAVASGEAEFGFGSTRTYWAGIAQGARIATIMEQSANGWSIVGLKEIQGCADLDGRRLAVHSEGSVSKAMLDVYLLEDCPAVVPEILIIPGSENRAAALLAGQIDATPLEPADAVQVMKLAGDQMHVIVDFAVTLPDLVTTGVFVNLDFAQDHPEAVGDLVRTLLMVHREIAADPQIVVPEAVQRLGMAPADIPDIMQAHIRIGTWDVNGGLTLEALAYSLDFFALGGLDPSLTPEATGDLSYLQAALDELDA